VSRLRRVYSLTRPRLKGTQVQTGRMQSLELNCESMARGECTTWEIRDTKIRIKAVRREGVGRFIGLPLWTDWGGKGGCLPLILPLASAVGFCLSTYRRWDKRVCRLCILCRWRLLIPFSSVGNVHLFCCKIKAFTMCPGDSLDNSMSCLMRWSHSNNRGCPSPRVDTP
jgi:hypothetical protein